MLSYQHRDNIGRTVTNGLIESLDFLAADGQTKSLP